MKPKKQSQNAYDLFRSNFEQILNLEHPLVKLSDSIDWETFDKKLESLYCPDNGAPALPTRLMVGIHYLKHTFNESDESVVDRWLENPYWQYFCGYHYFQHENPFHPTSMTKWRNRVGASGIELMLVETIRIAQDTRLLKKKDVEKVNVDTTVQEKNITYPTDAKLYYKMRDVLVNAAEKHGIKLRQNYRRVAKKALHCESQSRRSKKYKTARKMQRRLKTMLGCVKRDIERNISTDAPDSDLFDLLSRADRLLRQKKHSKNKLYSVHEPHVECIAKGKTHKKYEFGNKVSFVTSSKKNFILGIQ